MEPAEKKKSFLRSLIEFVVYIAVVFLAAYLIITFVAVRTIVDGHSMNPRYEDKDNLIVQKISYYLHEPERFDVIVFELKDQPGVHYIKRIIGLPGETVQIIDGYVYINGEKLTDDVYGAEVIEPEKYYTAAVPLQIGENEYFCMGDNRNHSKDSRSVGVGMVSRDQFLGKAWVRIWPLNRIGFLND